MQTTTSATNKKIAELFDSIKSNKLILNPAFQRKLVWNQKHKEEFIDTILKGYPFPEIYVADHEVNTEDLSTTQSVVDGQQRLSTIVSYLKGELECKTIRKYSDLTEPEKKNFLNYDVVVRDLKAAPQDFIIEVFRRINMTSYSLTPVEIEHAIYDGEFISTAKDLLEFFVESKLSIFSENEMSRMADLNFILLTMATIEENGYFSNNTLTEGYIKQYNDEYYNSEIIKDRFQEIISTVKSLELQDDSIWYRKSNFFTLLIELYKTDNIPDDLKQKLNDFENNILSNRNNSSNEFGQYYNVMYTGTNSKTSRNTRASLFRKYVLNI